MKLRIKLAGLVVYAVLGLAAHVLGLDSGGGVTLTADLAHGPLGCVLGCFSGLG